MKMMITNGSLYAKLKFVALVALPAVGSLYFALAGIWNLPAAEQVVGTIVAVDTFLGVLLHISTAQYTSQPPEPPQPEPPPPIPIQKAGPK